MKKPENWVSLGDLFAIEGVPVPSDGAIMVSSEPSALKYHHLPQPTGNIKRALNASASVSTETDAKPSSHIVGPNQLFESSEHSFIGDHVLLYFPDPKNPTERTQVLSKDRPLNLKTNAQLTSGQALALTYGNIIALGGDFYGIPNSPISDDVGDAHRQGRFLQAFQSLESNPPVKIYSGVSPDEPLRAEEGSSEPLAILKVMKMETRDIMEGLKEGESEYQMYQKMEDELTDKFVILTGGIPLTKGIPDPRVDSRYIALASKNYDHFGFHAEIAYRAGHTAALFEALKGYEQKDEKLLERAYAMNAFADHYLTDLFAAGHLRVPRRELENSVLWGVKKYHTLSLGSVCSNLVGGLCSKMMHDEDNAMGLFVRNKKGYKWRTYGDKQYFDTVNRTTQEMSHNAVQASIQEIWDVYQYGSKSLPSADAYEALTWTPILSEILMQSPGKANYAPLYLYSSARAVGESGSNQMVVLRRKDLANTNSFAWQELSLGLHGCLPKIKMYTPAIPTNVITKPSPQSKIKVEKNTWQPGPDHESSPCWEQGNEIAFAYSYVIEGEDGWVNESRIGEWTKFYTIKNEIKPALRVPQSEDQRITHRYIYALCKNPKLDEPIQYLGKLPVSENIFQIP